jgi:hypothetical protein
MKTRAYKQNVYLLVVATLLLTLFSLHAEAKRTVRMPKIDSAGGWTGDSSGYGPTGTGLIRKVDFVNLSSIPQTVKVTLKSIYFVYGTCATGLGGSWNLTRSTPAPPCYDQKISLPDMVINLVVPANGTERAEFLVACQVTTGGMTNCSGNSSPIDTSTWTLNSFQVSQNTADAAIEIEVAEDRGALLANVMSWSFGWGVDFKTVSRFNTPVNGGRAF